MSKSKPIKLSFKADGHIVGIYDDELAGLLESASEVSITRASFVEPGEDGFWYADLAPSGGPKLGPFRLRAAALDAEHAWLERKMFNEIA